MNINLHVIGSGCPEALKDRYGSCFVLQIDEEYLMVDCGPASTYKLAIAGINETLIHKVFLTHHHFDHNVDFPCFALSRWDMCINGIPPLDVYGPHPTEDFIEKLLGKNGAFYPDWHSRITHPVSRKLFESRGGKLPRPMPQVNAFDVSDGTVTENGKWKATAAVVKHVDPELISLAYRFDTNGYSIVFAGDCANCEELVELAKGTETLVAACTFFEKDIYYRDVITGVHDMVDITVKTGVKKLILSHMNGLFSIPGVKERAISEIAREYSGEIILQDEITCINLKKEK
jgi:ribonuclease BN (tRNA processing enzyme)